MSETFSLDTSGHVADPIGAPIRVYFWTDLSPFVQGYTAPILEAVEAPFHKLAPETLAAILKDCEARELAEPRAYNAAGQRQMGAWFWRARQEGYLVASPPLQVYLGDDGLVRFAALSKSEGDAS